MPAEATSLSVAGERDREDIYALRHQVYAHELGEHPSNEGSFSRIDGGSNRSFVAPFESGSAMG
jgi:hypothetical protein